MKVEFNANDMALNGKTGKVVKILSVHGSKYECETMHGENLGLVDVADLKKWLPSGPMRPLF
jgi:hypothetical protein